MYYQRLINGFWIGLVLCYSGLGYASEFAGSESCKGCHAEIYEQYRLTGHPYKLQQIRGKPPSYPDNTSPGVPNPPTSHRWEDLSYVIGGFAWKARFMDKEGFILTGPDRQYNLANSDLGLSAHWTAYEGEVPGRKPYTCGGCHTTGWTPTGTAGPHQNGLPGIHGTWIEAGVTCEACHGPGAAHVADPVNVDLRTAENCGSCHSRGDVNAIDASGGLIRHHEQYEDLLASPHEALACGSCHSPHQSTVYETGGIQSGNSSCIGCHSNVEIALESKSDMACASCHMPLVAKSAVSDTVAFKGGSVPRGDLRTHIQRITLDPDWRMFTDDGQFVRLDSEGRAHLTLDYACMSCHTKQDLEWARANAGRIHGKVTKHE